MPQQDKQYRIEFWSPSTGARWYWTGTRTRWSMSSSRAWLYKTPTAALKAIERRLEAQCWDYKMQGAEINWVTTY
jgi:hypothetical protein